MADNFLVLKGGSPDGLGVVAYLNSEAVGSLNLLTPFQGHTYESLLTGGAELQYCIFGYTLVRLLLWADPRSEKLYLKAHGNFRLSAGHSTCTYGLQWQSEPKRLKFGAKPEVLGDVTVFDTAPKRVGLSPMLWISSSGGEAMSCRPYLLAYPGTAQYEPGIEVGGQSSYVEQRLPSGAPGRDWHWDDFSFKVTWPARSGGTWQETGYGGLSFSAQPLKACSETFHLHRPSRRHGKMLELSGNLVHDLFSPRDSASESYVFPRPAIWRATCLGDRWVCSFVGRAAKVTASRATVAREDAEPPVPGTWQHVVRNLFPSSFADFSPDEEMLGRLHRETPNNTDRHFLKLIIEGRYPQWLDEWLIVVFLTSGRVRRVGGMLRQAISEDPEPREVSDWLVAREADGFYTWVSLAIRYFSQIGNGREIVLPIEMQDARKLARRVETQRRAAIEDAEEARARDREMEEASEAARLAADQRAKEEMERLQRGGS